MLFITGIHKASQLRHFDPAGWLGRRRRIAIDLIDDIDRLGAPAIREALFERIVDARGAFKRTYRDRFAAFDARLIELWQAAPLAARPVRILDAAISDGSTSLPLIAAFETSTAGEFRFLATDLDGRYRKLWRPAAPERRVILSDQGEIVQIILPPFLFTHRESRLLFPLNRALRPLAHRFAGGLIDDWQRASSNVVSAEILLFSPDFRRVLESDRRVEFQAWDILQPWPGERAHCVRAMNILNPGYFNAEQMRQVVRHLFAAVADGGLIALGSNEDAGSAVDGVICRRDGDRLLELASFGHGFRAPAAIEGMLIPAVASPHRLGRA